MYQVKTNTNTCNIDWEFEFSAYGLYGNKGEFPEEVQQIYIYQRSSYPFDSVITTVKTPPAGYRLIDDEPVFVLKLQENILKPIDNVENLKSTSFDFTWKPSPKLPAKAFKKYALQIKPIPSYWLNNGIMNYIPIYNNNDLRYNFRFLDPDTEYTIEVITMNQQNREYLEARQKFVQTTPVAGPNVRLTTVTSTNIGLIWDQNPEIEYYDIQFEEIESANRGVDLDEVVAHTIDNVKANTLYLVSITGYVNDFTTTDTTQLMVTTSPAPPELYFQAVGPKSAKIGFVPVEGFSTYEFEIYGPPIDGLESGLLSAEQNEFLVKPGRNSIYELSIRGITAAGDSEANENFIRTTDRIDLKRIYSYCQFSENDNTPAKLNCKPKYQSTPHTDGFDWMINDKGQFVTFDGEIDLGNVVIAHFEGNQIQDYSLLQTVISELKLVETLNLSENKLGNTLPTADLLINNPECNKLDLSNNTITELPIEIFRNAGEYLSKISLANNPLEECGLTQEILSPIKEQLTFLDLRNTGLVEGLDENPLGIRDLMNVFELDAPDFLAYRESQPYGTVAWEKFCEE